MTKKSGYRQLQPEERITLASLRQQSYSLREIGKALSRSASSISRELQRIATPQGYVARDAQIRAAQRRQEARPWPKLHADLKLWRVVKSCLSWRSSGRGHSAAGVKQPGSNKQPGSGL